MYSRIPMPKVEWREENRRYSLGLFPIIGAVIGGLIFGWGALCRMLGFNSPVFAAVAVLIPIAVTGGIHLDGFCDFTDARCSFADKQKRLEIMSDPHIGSFAAIYACLYLMIQGALWTQVDDIRLMGTAALCFVMSRALSGISAVTFRAAKSEGTLQSFVKPSHKGVNIGLGIFFFAAAAAGGAVLSPLSGAAAAVTALIVFAYYRHAAYSTLGGTTGDLCGWFLQLCEIWTLAAAVSEERESVMIR